MHAGACFYAGQADNSLSAPPEPGYPSTTFHSNTQGQAAGNYGVAIGQTFTVASPQGGVSDKFITPLHQGDTKYILGCSVFIPLAACQGVALECMFLVNPIHSLRCIGHA